jgi:hypothetical protein
VVITKCEFTYIQLAERDDPSPALRPGLEARLEEEPERALRVDTWRAFSKAEAGLAVHDPRTIRYR